MWGKNIFKKLVEMLHVLTSAGIDKFLPVIYSLHFLIHCIGKNINPKIY